MCTQINTMCTQISTMCTQISTMCTQMVSLLCENGTNSEGIKVFVVKTNNIY